jgi:hypothetical protein
MPLMTSTASPCGVAFAGVHAADPAPARGISRWLQRLAEHFMNMRQRRADAEIVRYLERTGGRLTDAVERDVMQHVFQNDWSLRR